MKDYSQLLADDHYCIFLLHGVIPDDYNYGIRNYNREHIREEEFIRLIDQLTSKGNPLCLNELIKIKKMNTDLPPKAFSITFDDGFLNNYTIAAPILSDARFLL